MSPSRIGRTIRRLREARGLTQDALAANARISQTYLSFLEKGVRRNPSVGVARRLAKALGVPITELLGGL